MYKRAVNIVFLLIIAVLFWLISFTFNDWFSTTMPRHQLMQIPAMLVLGICTGLLFLRHIYPGISWALAILIFVMASLIFWMLPHSIDYSVVNPSFNRVMHADMFLSGMLAVPVLKNAILEIRIIFLGMVAAMLMAVGITLKVYDILLCSSFDIFQQKETGAKLLFIGAGFFAITIFTFFYNAAKGAKGAGHG